MKSEILEAMTANHRDYVEKLKLFTDEQLIKHLENELKEVEEVRIPIEQMLPLWLDENADELLEMAPAKHLHKAIASHLAKGKPLSTKATQWFAERVLDPKLLNQRRGPKPKHMYHHQIRRLMRIIVDDLGKKTKDAIELMEAAAPLSHEQIRDIYYNKKKSG